MYRVYKITNKINNKYYIGMTKQELGKRFSQHKTASKRASTKSYLYNAMKKYGVENFEIEQLFQFENREDCCNKEIECISKNLDGYNLAKGGEIGFSMLSKSEEEISEWKESLSKSRKGKRPALGMKHTEENKLLFSKVSKEYWASQETYNWEEIKEYSHREAKEKFGISTTHYYRLKKQNGEKPLNRSEAAKQGWKNLKNNNLENNDSK